MSQVTEQSVRFQTALASIKLIQASAVLDLTEDDFDFLTSNKVWIATDRSRARRCVEDRKSGSAGMPRSEERFSRNAETDLVCRLLLEKKKVPCRPYVIVLSESREVQSAGQVPADPNDGLGPVRPHCPGSLLRVVYVGDQEYYWSYGDERGLMRGDLYPKTVGVFGLLEQQFENCTATGHKPGTAVVRAAYSLHNALVFPHIVFATYYGGGLRAIDITDAFSPVEVGYYFGQPVKQVRWAHEIAADTVMKPDGSGLAQSKPSAGPPDLIHFSYVDSYNGLLIFGDINNGLYIV